MQERCCCDEVTIQPLRECRRQGYPPPGDTHFLFAYVCVCVRDKAFTVSRPHIGQCFVAFRRNSFAH